MFAHALVGRVLCATAVSLAAAEDREIPERPSTPAVWMLIEQAAGDDQDYAIHKRTQAALVKSSGVLDRALRDAEVQKLPSVSEQGDTALDWISEHLRVNFPNDAEIMRLTFHAGPIDDRVAILNAVSREYQKLIADVENDEATKLRDAFLRVRDELRAKTDALELLKRKFRQTATTELQDQLRRQRIERLADRRNDIENKIHELELQIALVKQKDKEASIAHLDEERAVYVRHMDELDRLIDGQIAELKQTPSTEIVMRQRDLEQRKRKNVSARH